jgi:hypothetical protein
MLEKAFYRTDTTSTNAALAMLGNYTTSSKMFNVKTTSMSSIELQDVVQVCHINY